MFKILASEPVTNETTALAWWRAWTLLLVALVVFNEYVYGQIPF